MKNFYQTVLSICLLACSSVSFSQVPALSSHPSAAATIFLDFDGQLVENTAWNWSGPLNCSPANLTEAQIIEIFNRVAEDYRPFNINITTDSARYWSAPLQKRVRVILTTSSSWYGSAGGVAYIGSFTWGDNTPAFVFTALLGYNTKNVAEAAAHEAGHTLGLRHQSAYDVNCVKTSEYNPGTGSGEIAWAPIMGVGYYRNMTLWNYGANPFGCANYQDDLGVITGPANGFGYRADDHAAVSDVGFVNSQFQVSGIIERISDEDNFQFTLPVTGKIHVEAVPYSLGSNNSGSNLDMQVSLVDAASNIIGVYNPQYKLDAVVDTVLPAGSYFIRVEPKGNAYAPEYATLGSYSLRGSYTAFGTLPVRQLELAGKKEKDKHQLSWVIDADENVVQQTLEVSSNGIYYEAVGVLSAQAKTFAYVPRQAGLLRYRLRVKFDNGSQYYSNIVVLDHQQGERPRLIGNKAVQKLTVSSPADFDYAIHDYSGRLLSRGRLADGNNLIEIASFSSGIYLVRFSNGAVVYTDKFLKQ